MQPTRRPLHAALGTAPSASGPAAAAERAAATAEARQDAALRSWLTSNGGFVHPAISLSAATQCGSRGLVASKAISLEALEAGSLVSVPRALHLDDRAARAVVAQLLGPGPRLDAFEALAQVQQVACVLALERLRGADSFWRPYLDSLPPQPPNPWLLAGGDLAAAVEQAAHFADLDATEVQALAEADEGAASRLQAAAVDVESSDEDDGGRADRAATEATEAAAASAASARSSAAAAAGMRGGGWAAAAVAAAAKYGDAAEEVLDALGRTAAVRQMGLDREGLMWAMGHVASRSLGSGDSAGLLPYVDLANHDEMSRPPMLILDDRDQLVYSLTSIRDGELAPLAAGQELFISYQAEDMSALQAWLKFGFVPKGLVPAPVR
ncbi:hypothetical protein HYH03_007657 [Edaphochlamys debaryana]|uniref:SET domain-containing protein n=1 Tax=Edaphochlamys debaryana TaxID=47281 RepID=A0A836C0C0_9CHLO|nr:hypothetical protein HYH03_007657 [Edaphochlamys debaryana]|eukprot:KAG2494304.1 hypothetical protein HYH03_007657 [Edaphochlamys debaryana]